MRIFAAVVGALFSLGALAAEPPVSIAAPYLEGKDYSQLEEPVKTADPSKIEVAEVFAYTCPHCFHFEPLVEAWIKTQKSDVSLVQVHTKWSSQMEPYQRGYYTAVLLKIKDKVQLPVFKAIHEQQQQLGTAEQWADFLSAYGVSKASVLSSYDSFVVTGMIDQADARTKAYRISGTPELVIDGKYRVSTRSGGSHEGMLKVAQFLVDKIRAERAATKH